MTKMFRSNSSNTGSSTSHTRDSISSSEDSSSNEASLSKTNSSSDTDEPPINSDRSTAPIESFRYSSFNSTSEDDEPVSQITTPVRLYIELIFELKKLKHNLEKSMLREPRILEELPENITPGNYYKTSSSMFGDVVRFHYDCGYYNRDQVEKGLQLFREHYNNFNHGFPKVTNHTEDLRENEIIDNLKNAIKGYKSMVISSENTEVNFRCGSR